MISIVTVRDIPLIVIGSILWMLAYTPLACAQGEGAQAQLDTYPEIITKKGAKYTACAVKRVEADALTITHSKGVARISFFDLDESWHRKYDFDPVAALQKYKVDKQQQRDLRWKQFWAKQKVEASRAQAHEKAEFKKKVLAEWIPVEAAVLGRNEKGIFAEALQIRMVPTTVKSSLGIERPGPPRKTLVPLTDGVIFIETTEVSGANRWLGYLEPDPYRKVALPDRPTLVPSYRAVSREDIQ